MNWYLAVLRNYAGFSGRASRQEYWMFVLFNLIFSFLAVILDNVFGIALNGLGYGPIYGLYALAVLLPSLAVSVRRLHDVGKSGWMVLLAFIPLVGAVWLLVLFLMESKVHENEYGESPESFDDENEEESDSTGDSIIIAIIIWMLFAKIFWSIIPIIFNDFFTEPWFKSVNITMTLVGSMIPLALAFAVKHQKKRIALFVIGGIYLVYTLIDSITRFTQ